MTKQTESNLVKVLNVLAKEPNQTCEEALEPTVAELNDEYLRDTHVEGIPKDRDCCTEGCIKCDARKILAETQETVVYQPTSQEQSVMHSAMIRSSKLVHKAKPPSREWKSLSDEEIESMGEEYISKHLARAVEAKLREKNG